MRYQLIITVDSRCYRMLKEDGSNPFWLPADTSTSSLNQDEHQEIEGRSRS